jgi:hypothetical protein
MSSNIDESLPILVLKLVAVGRMDELVVTTSGPLNKDEDHPALKAVVRPNLKRSAF